jgi:hypothetical protein
VLEKWVQVAVGFVSISAGFCWQRYGFAVASDVLSFFWETFPSNPSLLRQTFLEETS